MYPYSDEVFASLAQDLAALIGGAHVPHKDCATTHDIEMDVRKVTIAQTEYRHGADMAEGDDLAWIPLVFQDESEAGQDKPLFYYIALSNRAPWDISRVLAQLHDFVLDALTPPEGRKYEISDNPCPFGRFAGGIAPVLVQYDAVVAEGQT